MTEFFEVSGGGIGLRLGGRNGLGIAFTRKADNNDVVISHIEAGPGGHDRGRITVTNYTVTAEEWREVERALQIAK